jgi:membrane-bound lytic murein transglycosylase D
LTKPFLIKILFVFLFLCLVKLIEPVNDLIFDISANEKEVNSNTDKAFFNLKNFTSDSLQAFPDIYFEYRIAELNKKTPVELDYNKYVKEYIDIYTKERRSEFERILGRAGIYFPVFEAYLDKYDLPLELKYLTVIESGLNPRARSASGATGLWQFLYNTCKLFDLKVDSYIDERMDLYKSTDAACKYLKYLYGTFHDWQLVVAAYNGGPGEVRKAIERSGGKTGYWEIRPYLSEQSKRYLPAFIAVNYLMNFYSQYNFKPLNTGFDFYDIDTLRISYAVSFQQISKTIAVPIDTLRFLNPMYKRDYIPELNHPALLVLPAGKISLYLENENNLLAYRQKKSGYLETLASASSTKGKMKIVHIVHRGEFFHKIAMEYNCTVENLKAWNNISDNELYPGQKIDIWVNPDK